MADNVSKGQHSVSANNRSRGLMIVVTHTVEFCTLHPVAPLITSFSFLLFLPVLCLWPRHTKLMFCNPPTATCDVALRYGPERLELITTAQNASNCVWQSISYHHCVSSAVTIWYICFPNRLFTPVKKKKKRWLDNYLVTTNLHLMCLYFGAFRGKKII